MHTLYIAYIMTSRTKKITSIIEVLRNAILNTVPDYEQDERAMGYLEALQDLEEKLSG